MAAGRSSVDDVYPEAFGYANRLSKATRSKASSLVRALALRMVRPSSSKTFDTVIFVGVVVLLVASFTSGQADEPS